MVTFTDRYGTAGADALTGTGSNQRLFGGPGDDVLRAGPYSAQWLMGGSGADTYTYSAGRYNFVLLETGGTSGDHFAESSGVAAADMIVTIDQRHLMFMSSVTGDSMLILDWTKPANVIETWELGNHTFTHQEIVSTITRIPIYYGDYTLEGVLGASGAAEFGALIDQAYAKAAAFDAPVSTPVVTPTATGGATAGDDELMGSTGNDTFDGAAGNDTIVGLTGDDVLSGGGGADMIYANQGADSLFGGDGADALFGGQDNDLLSGGNDADVIYGNMGSDRIDVVGADTVFGGQGDDVIDASSSAAVLYGNRGDDTISAGAGSVVHGGAGADRFIPGVSVKGNIVIADFNGAEGDRIARHPDDSLLSVTADASGNTVITLSQAGTVTLQGIAPSSFSDTWIV
ncbi:MAG TPA: calcium-binding protein [Azospirillum sp.]